MDLSQINYNKKKVINEDDLYDLQKRKFEEQNIDEKIKEMKIRKKEILHKCKINYKKLNAIKNFAKNIENSYNLLKPLKLKTSVINFTGPTGFNDNMIKEMDEGLNDMEEIKEDENEYNNEENDDNLVQENNLIDEDINYTQRSFSGRNRINLSNKKIINNSFHKKNSIKEKRKKHNGKIKRKIKRSKSK